ncbi:leukocyte immunoglobulin-like receptor subfamily A member 5 isoform X1 [Microtus pennsylvanicus]|uniref:leukocyte immunoglobulin-like receptor subfamily A member 5 isoform X1 n=1 Tax=Microtus pennsylvanicus TaxID=10058 RepID=UPI003F6A5357
MIFTAIAMLCLGLTLGFRSPVLAGHTYSKPKLSALDSHVVNAGGNVTLQCISWQRYDGFILIKEGEPKFSRTLDSQYIFTGHLQAMFSLGPMTSRNTGIFRCYGFYKRDPQKWSMPSDPLEVHISEAVEPLRLSPNISDPKTVSQPQDYTKENLIRIGVSVLVLVLLGILLYEDQHSQRRIQSTASRENSASVKVAETSE